MLAKTRGWKTTIYSLWLGCFLPLTKNTISMFAIIWYYTQSTGSATTLALITAFKMLPSALIAPIGGVFADRFSRKKVLIICNISISVLSFLLGILFCADLMKLSYMYLLVFLTESCASIIIPIMQASVPMIAPKEKIAKMVGVMSAFIGLYTVIGQAGGALLIKYFNISTVMFINCGIALTAVIPYLFIKIPQPIRIISESKEKSSFIGDFLFGIKYIIKFRKFLGLVILGFFGTLLIYPPVLLLPLLVKNGGGGSGLYATGMMVYGVANIAVAILVGIIGSKIKMTSLMIGGVFSMPIGILLLIVPVIPLTIRVITSCAFLGSSVSFFVVPFLSILSTEVEKEVQGRVMSVASSIMYIASPIGLVIAGPVGDALGIATTFVIDAVLVCILGFAGIKILKYFNTNPNNVDKSIIQV